MKMKLWAFLLPGLLILTFWGLWAMNKIEVYGNFSVGEKIDSLNGVYVYYNGTVNSVSGRNVTADGYNLGLKYQCVEFAKRYFYAHLEHKMPDSFGHAKDFFDKTLKDGQKSQRRGLIQYNNPSYARPRVDDLLVFEGTLFNRYGHVAIISCVRDNELEIIQQNPGMFSGSRETLPFFLNDTAKWEIRNNRVLGWLRKE